MAAASVPEKWIISALEDWFLRDGRIGRPEQIVRSDTAFADDVQEDYLKVLAGHRTYESFLIYRKNDLRVLSADVFNFLLPKIVAVAMQNPQSELMDYFVYIVSDIIVGEDYYDSVFQALNARQIYILCMAIMIFGAINCDKDDFLFFKINQACFVLLRYSILLISEKMMTDGH